MWMYFYIRVNPDIYAIRVPMLDLSIMDMVFIVGRNTPAEEVYIYKYLYMDR